MQSVRGFGGPSVIGQHPVVPKRGSKIYGTHFAGYSLYLVMSSSVPINVSADPFSGN